MGAGLSVSAFDEHACEAGIGGGDAGLWNTIKISGGDRVERVHPEYEDVSAAARRCGAAFNKVYEAAMSSYAARQMRQVLPDQ